MSDTVKLIIEIPKWEYEQACKFKDSFFYAIQVKAIQNGTPLDDVKAEIKNDYYTEKEPSLYQAGTNFGLSLAVEILDNIGKAEEGGE